VVCVDTVDLELTEECVLMAAATVTLLAARLVEYTEAASVAVTLPPEGTSVALPTAAGAVEDTEAASTVLPTEAVSVELPTEAMVLVNTETASVALVSVTLPT